MPTPNDIDRLTTLLVHTDILLVEDKIKFTGDGEIVAKGNLNITTEGNGRVLFDGQEIGPIEWFDESVSQGFANKFDATGAAVSVAVVGDTAVLSVTTTGPTQPEARVHVSPNFSPSDTFQQYPTIALGIARAQWLITNDPGISNVEIHVESGIYTEKDLTWGNGITVRFSPEAILRPDATASSFGFKVTGTGGIDGMRVEPQGSGAIPVGLIGAGWGGSIEGLSIRNLTATRSALLEFEDQAAFTTGSFLKNLVLVDFTATPAPLISGSGYWFIFAVDSLFFQNAGTAESTIKWADGSIPFSASVMTLNASSILNFSGGSEIELTGTDARIDLYGTHVDLNNVSVGGDLDQITFVESTDIEQTVYPRSGESKGSVDEALTTILADSTAQGGRLDSAENNIGIMAAELTRQFGISAGDYEGFAVEDFTDASGLSAIDNAHLEADSYNSFVELDKRILVENFESYADTAALQAAWVSSDVANTIPTLVQTGAPQGSKFMNVSFNAPQSNGDTITFTYGTNQNWATLDHFMHYGAGLGDASQAPLRLILEDSTTAQAVWPYRTQQGNWAERTWFFEDATIPVNFRWWEIKKVIFQVGTLPSGTIGTWSFDFLNADIEGAFTQRALLDSMDALTNWTSSGTTLTLGTTTPRQGTGYLVLDGGAGQGPGAFTVTRTWPGSGTYADLVIADEVIRINVRAASVVLAGNIANIGLVLEDENGNTASIAPQVAIPRPVTSGDIEWQPYEFYIPDAQFTEPSPPFDITKIVKISLSSGGGNTGTWKLHIDFLQVGNSGKVVSTLFTTNIQYNQIKVFASYAGYSSGKVLAQRTGEDDFRVLVSSGSTADYNILLLRLGIIKSIAPYGSDKVSDWHDINLSSVDGKGSFRILGRRETQLAGLTIMVRKV